MCGLSVSLGVAAIDKDIVHVDCHLVARDEVCEDRVHQGLENSWRVGEPKVHNTWFEEPSICDEGSLPLVFLLDSNVVIASSYIELREDTGSFQLIDDVSCKWKGVAILDCDLVKLSVVLYKMKVSVLLLHKEHW